MANRFFATIEGDKIFIGATQTLAEHFGISQQAVCENYGKSGQIRYKGGVRWYRMYEVMKVYDFYDAWTGKVIAENKSWSSSVEDNQTGFTRSELEKMIAGRVIEDLTAKLKLVCFEDTIYRDRINEILEEQQEKILRKELGQGEIRFGY